MNDKMYYTYIVASRSHNFYVGMTSEIEIRIEQHKKVRFEGYSKKYNRNRLSGLSVIRLLRMLSLERNS